MKQLTLFKQLPLSLVFLTILSGCSEGTSTTPNPFNDPNPVNTNTVNTGVIATQIANEYDDAGSILNVWRCFGQNEAQVSLFEFNANGNGKAQIGANGARPEITWSEVSGNTILMSIASTGDSQLQSITFQDTENFTTTDSSLAGTATGPLRCELGTRYGASEPPYSTVESGPQTPVDEAVEEAINEADGTESTVAVLNSSLPGATWSCGTTGSGASVDYTITFNTNGSGDVASTPMSWSTNEDNIPGLIFLSIDSDNDGAIVGITVENSNFFTARYARFGSLDIDYAQQVQCSR